MPTGTNYVIFGAPERPETDGTVASWLQQRGVSRKRALRFLDSSGCESLHDMSVFLRVKLAPLDMANVDCIDTEMKDLFGVSGRSAHRIIKDLDVLQAINPEISDEASTFLQASGLLSTNLTNMPSTPTGMRSIPTAQMPAGDAVAGDSLTPRLDGFARASGPPPIATAPLNSGAAPGQEGDTGNSGQAQHSAASLYSSGHQHSGAELAKPNAFGSFLCAPVLPVVASSLNNSAEGNGVFANPAAGPYGPGASAPLGTPRSEALTIDLQPPGGLSMRGHFKGLPTVSHALEPGPYHKANARLRAQFPHYNVIVRTRVHWDHVFMFVLTLVIYIGYIGLRGYYLVSGRAEDFEIQNISVTYSWVVLCAELLSGFLLFFSNQLFWKQELTYSVMPEEEVGLLTEEVHSKGVMQTVHVLITTYSEPADMVRESILRLLIAPEPIYMEKNIYVCDDGYAKKEGPKKRDMVEQLRILGHTNVHYVGDRVKKPSQLNGKSANLNHVLFQKIYPMVTHADEVPDKDIIMVMDCDHMVKPEIFNMMGPCMRDPKVGVCLAPQAFHNLILPDWFDSANSDFNLAKMPYSFGAGNSFITGTNVMIRARAAFQVCRYAASNAATDVTRPLGAANEDNRQIYAEDEISEDVELGARMHAYGYKSVIVGERLASGEVPLDPRSMWRQRLRWMKGGHLYVMAPNSIFFKRSPHMSFYQKSLYWICPVANFIQLFTEPIMFTLPFFCLVLKFCPYGMDIYLFWSHFVHVAMSFVFSIYHWDSRNVGAALSGKSATRILWFTAVKACLNTLMVMTGFKKAGHFKFTPKAGVQQDEAAVSTALNSFQAMSERPGSTPTSIDIGPNKSFSNKGSPATPSKSQVTVGKHDRKAFEFSDVHDALSKVTETRKWCLPMDGTLDMWVLMSSTLLSLTALVIGVVRLVRRDALLDWSNKNSLMWIGVVFALVDTAPGALFLGYMATYDWFPGFLKLYCPLLVALVALCVTLIEVRMAIGFTAGI